MKTLLSLIVAASTALAVPPIAPPAKVVPQSTESVCRSTFERMCRIISEMHLRGEIDDAEKLGLPDCRTPSGAATDVCSPRLAKAWRGVSDPCGRPPAKAEIVHHANGNRLQAARKVW